MITDKTDEELIATIRHAADIVPGTKFSIAGDVVTADMLLPILATDAVKLANRLAAALEREKELKETWSSPEQMAATNKFHDEQTQKLEMSFGSTIASFELEIASLKRQLNENIALARNAEVAELKRLLVLLHCAWKNERRLPRVDWEAIEKIVGEK